MSEVCDPVTQHGSHYIKWIHMLFGSCVYGNREAASLLLGVASIGCWLNAQFPQLITNYKNKSAYGLSIQFLLIWLFGDITNFIGCILTKQLPFQTYLSMYFCTVDCALFLQYFYYTWSSPSIDDCEEDKELRRISTTSRVSSIRSSSDRIIDTNSNNSNSNNSNNNNNNNNNNSSSSSSNNNNNSSNSNSKSLKKSINDNSKKNYSTFPSKKKEVISVTTLFALLLLTFNPTSTTSSTYSPISTSPSSSLSQLQSQTLYLPNKYYYSSQPSYPNHDEILITSSLPSFFKNFFENNSLIIGRVMAWICTTLYLTSRMPQIWKNHQRKSVEGLSIIMFIFAALGNLTYTMSIFANPAASSDPLFLIDKIPYIIGSVGTLSFDITIFLQWCAWKDRIHHHRPYYYRRTRSATNHSHSSKRLSSSTHKLGYNTLPSNYNFKKQSRGSRSSDDIGRSIILTNGELVV